MINLNTNTNITVEIERMEDFTGGDKIDAPINQFVISVEKGDAQLFITDWIFDGSETAAQRANGYSDAYQIDAYLGDEIELEDTDLDTLETMPEFAELVKFVATTDFEEIMKSMD